MNISVSQAAKDWNISRTTIYQKISSGELSRGPDKKIDTSEMIRVFGEPNTNEQKNVQSKHVLNTVQKTQANTSTEQKLFSDVQHKLELEQLKNEHLRELVANKKKLIDDYQNQIHQLNKNLAQAVASINEFAQTRLLELKRDTQHPQTESQPSLPSKPKIEKILMDDNRSKPKVRKKSRLKSIVSILVGIE